MKRVLCIGFVKTESEGFKGFYASPYSIFLFHFQQQELFLSCKSTCIKAEIYSDLPPKVLHCCLTLNSEFYWVMHYLQSKKQEIFRILSPIYKPIKQETLRTAPYIYSRSRNMFKFLRQPLLRCKEKGDYVLPLQKHMAVKTGSSTVIT